MPRIVDLDWRRELRVVVISAAVFALLLVLLPVYYFIVPSVLTVSVFNEATEAMDGGEVLVGPCSLTFAPVAPGHATEKTTLCVPAGDVRIKGLGAVQDKEIHCGYLMNPAFASILKVGRVELRVSNGDSDGSDSGRDLLCQMRI